MLWIKNLVKHFMFLPNKMFRGYLMGWPFLQNTRELDSLMWLFSFQSCASHVAFSQVTSRELVSNCIDSSLKLDFSPISYTHSLQIKPHTYREMIEEITIKFVTKLKPTQTSWKSQLHRERGWYGWVEFVKECGSMAAIMENREYEFGIWGKWWRDFGFGFGFWNFFYMFVFKKKFIKKIRKCKEKKLMRFKFYLV